MFRIRSPFPAPPFRVGSVVVDLVKAQMCEVVSCVIHESHTVVLDSLQRPSIIDSRNLWPGLAEESFGYWSDSDMSPLFDFLSASYGNLFMVANLQKLINVSPEAWQWLKSKGYVASPNQAQSARRGIR